MKKGFASTLIALIICFSAFSQTGTLSGIVRDAQSGLPLSGATLQFNEGEKQATTDSSGRYFFTGLVPKTYNLTASFVGYSPFTFYNIVIRSEGNIDVNFELVPETRTLTEVVLRPNPFRKPLNTPLSVQKLSQEEIAAYPGGNNDIAKVVQSFPGVSGSVGGFRNDVIIRGGAPNENVYYLDGIEIPNINHFSTQGSAGGPVGLLNVSFIEGVTLSTSSFGAQYDNALSGILQFDQRNGNANRFNTNFRLGSSEAAITSEGPLFKGNKEQSKTSFLVSARRSYLQLLFKALDLPFLPDYWDYQYKIRHQINARNEIIFTGVGSVDDLKINELKEFDAEQKAIQDQLPVIRQRSNTLGLSWRHRFRNNKGNVLTALSHNSLRNEFFQYTDNIQETGLYYSNDSKEQETRLRVTVTQLSGAWTFSYGGVVIVGDYSNKALDLVNNTDFNGGVTLTRYGAFGQAARKWLDNRLSLTLGLRTDGNNFTESGNEVQKRLSPRIGLSYQLDSKGTWTFNASAGRYFKIPPYTILGYRSPSNELVNRNSEYIQSDHLVAGIEYLVSPSARLTIEGFYKKYEDLPVSQVDQVSLANKGGGFEVLGSERVQSVGKGRTYGAEILFQQKFTGHWYAIGSLTFYRSEFTGFDTEKYLPAVWDNKVLVSLLGGYKMKKNWEISGRYRFLGRAPYAPVNVQATELYYPAIIRDYSLLGAVRLDPLSQLDIRVDKKWSFKKFSLDLFLDIQNVLGTDLPQEPRYGLDRDANGDIINPRRLVLVNASNSSTVLPSVGIVLNF